MRYPIHVETNDVADIACIIQTKADWRARAAGSGMATGQGSRRGGAAMVWGIILMVTLILIASLAVDYAKVQVVKTDLQRCADATARGYMAYCRDYGSSYADNNGPLLYGSNYNPVDANSGIQPSFTVEWGSWNANGKVFVPGNGGTTAVRVTASRTAAQGNAVPLTMAAIFGRKTCDVTCQSIATLSGGQSSSVTVSANANPYLAGMPAGTSNLAGDDFSNASPHQVVAIPVTPGTYLTFTNVSGSTNVLPGYVSDAGPGGLTSIPVHHGQNYNKSIDFSGPENGIADAIMPESAVMGLFLDGNAPNTTPAPTTVLDWTNPSVQNKDTYTDLDLKAPFMIGDGKTTGGLTQRFLVPPGATRFYIAIWDGIAYYNNSGSFTATVTVERQISVVK
jgi:hypothetical protein